MVSAVIHGAPLTTFDLDLVYDRTPGNIAKILAALEELDAYVRIQNGRRLTVDETHLASSGHKLLRTRFGRVDFLGAIGDDEDYAALLPNARRFDIDGLRVQVLSLSKYIELKVQAGRAKDLAVLPTLRALARSLAGC